MSEEDKSAQVKTPTPGVLVTCPNCGKSGSAEELFGSRTVNDVTQWQAWCRDCRKSGEKLPPSKN